jgi:hypothetical protein
MLKSESRSIKDSQVHSYLAHMKNKYHSNFYYSSAIFNKVKPKKGQKFNHNPENNQDHANINKLEHFKTNTSLHYVPLSTSKHKSQANIASSIPA